MTAPIGTGGFPAAALDLLGTAPAPALAGLANGASTPTAMDPASAPFAGLLARIVGEQGLRSAGATSDADAMLQAALASLESAVNESGAAIGASGAPDDAGTAAIKALIAQVTTGLAPNVHADTAANPASVTVVDTAAMTLGASAAVPLPAAPASTPMESAEAGATSSRSAKKNGETGTARTDRDAAETDQSATFTTENVAANTAAVVRDLASLDPAFREKLERVMQRMQSEFGHTVTVVETTRSQERQDALFAQGRTAPGQVVTWTRNSRHADGRAADVMIDGSYDNPVAYARLQRIANEEGLHTLGSRDLGHLELRVPQAGGFTTKMAQAIIAPPSLKQPDAPAPVRTADGANVMARIARVAHVAEVAVTAGVARVAAVARVAVPGSSAPVHAAESAPSAARNAAPVPNANPADAASALNATRGADAANTTGTARTGGAATAENAAASVANETVSTVKTATPSTAASNATSANAAASINESSASQTGSRERGSDSDARTPRRPAASSPDAVTPSAAPSLSAPRGTPNTSPIAQAAGPDQAARVAQIDALHEQKASQPVSSMVLNVDDGNGGTDRIRVDVRGSSVASQVDVRDPQAAAQLNARAAELSRALESRGLEADGLRVRTMAGTQNTDVLRSAAGAEPTSRALGAALSADASTPSRRDRDDARDPRSAYQQNNQDSPRQRSRREREEQRS